MAGKSAKWVDLLDPDEDAILEAVSPIKLHHSALQALLRPPKKGDNPRPSLRKHETYVFGVLLVPVAVNEEDRSSTRRLTWF